MYLFFIKLVAILLFMQYNVYRQKKYQSSGGQYEKRKHFITGFKGCT